MQFWRISAYCLSLCAGISPLWAASLPLGVREVTSVEGVTEYRLANGMQVLLAPDVSKPTVTVNVTYRVGSRMENYGETGMAHLLEHLMFKGTPDHRHITDELSKRGMRPNGTTWYDRTNYFESFPGSTGNLDWALEMEADRMTHSFIARHDLDSEMTVVRNEMESGENDPSSILMEKMMGAAYQWHNYGKSTIGARTDVENVNIAHLQAFYRKYYQPDNATLVVAGNFDVQKTLAKVNQTFGKIPKPKRVIEPTYTLDPVQDGEREVILRRSGDVQYVEAIYHSVPAASPESTDFRILAQVLGDTPSGRLHKTLVEKNLATSISSEYFGLDEPGVIYFEADLDKTQKMDAAKDVFLETIESLKAHPVSQEEVDRARTALLNNIEQTFNDPEQFGIALSSAIADGDWRLFFLNRDRLKTETRASVQQTAEEYLISSNRTLGLFYPTANPQRAPQPAKADVTKLLQDYHGNQDFAAGEAFDSSPVNIQNKTHWLTLENGPKMALLSKKTRGHTVHGQIDLHFGNADNLLNQERVGLFTADLMDKGAAGLTREEIQDRFNQLKANVAIGGGATGVHVVFETVKENLAPTLDLIQKILHAPAFPESEFNQEKSEELADIDSNRSEPKAVAGNALSRYYNQESRGDIRYTSTFDEATEDIQKVTLQQVKDFYQRFYGANHGQIAIVGDFDQAEIMPILTKGFANWSSKEQYAIVVNSYKEKPGTRIEIDLPDKANAIYLVRAPMALRDNDPKAVPLMLGNYVFGQGFLNSHLANRIRQKEGLSYGVGSYLRLNDMTNNSYLGIYAIYAPQNLSKLTTAINEVTQDEIKNGITELELNDARAALLKSRELARAQDGNLATQLSSLLYDDRDMTYTEAQEEALKSTDLKTVNQTFSELVKVNDCTTVVAGSFIKAH